MVENHTHGPSQSQSHSHSDSELTCPMCGNRFDPTAHLACERCPFNSGCMLSCCPACGYELPNPDRSQLVHLGSRIRGFARTALRRGSRARAVDPADGTVALSEVPPGNIVTVERIANLTGSRSEQLQAYGLVPGRSVKVIQQAPVTVVRVEHIDLAFESHIAREIRTALV